MTLGKVKVSVVYGAKIINTFLLTFMSLKYNKFAVDIEHDNKWKNRIESKYNDIENNNEIIIEIMLIR